MSILSYLREILLALSAEVAGVLICAALLYLFVTYMDSRESKKDSSEMSIHSLPQTNQPV